MKDELGENSQDQSKIVDLKKYKNNRLIVNEYGEISAPKIEEEKYESFNRQNIIKIGLAIIIASIIILLIFMVF